MDTRLLRSYLAVARSGSFTHAAAELGFTQSTVTSHVQKLERQLGVLLLDRLPGSVMVTDLGAQLNSHAEDVLAAEECLLAASKADGRPSGTVRVMAPETLCTYWLPQIITTVRRAEPEVQIWVTPGGVDDAIDSVRRGVVDLAVTMELRGPPTDLKLARLGTQSLVFLRSGKSADLSVVSGQAASWAELAEQDALLLEEGCGYSDHVADQLVATGRRQGRRSRFGSVEAVKRCVDVDLGWTVLPRLAVASEIRSGVLNAAEGPQLPDCEVHVVSHPRRYQSPAETVVLDALRRSWPPAPAQGAV